MLFQNEAKSKMCHAYSLLTYSFARLDNKDHKKEHSVERVRSGYEISNDLQYSGRKNVLRKLLRIPYRRLKAGFSVC